MVEEQMQHTKKIKVYERETNYDGYKEEFLLC